MSSPLTISPGDLSSSQEYQLMNLTNMCKCFMFPYMQEKVITIYRPENWESQSSCLYNRLETEIYIVSRTFYNLHFLCGHFRKELGKLYFSKIEFTNLFAQNLLVLPPL